MKKRKIFAAMKISIAKLAKRYGNRKRSLQNGDFIPTELPLVYRKDNEFTVEPGLNLKRKEELWGIQLQSGVMIALKCGAGKNVSSTKSYKVKEFAEQMRFEGKQGAFPNSKILKDYWGDEERECFHETVDTLQEYGIDADDYKGLIWCAGDSGLDRAVYFYFDDTICDLGTKHGRSKYDRVAVAF